MKFKSTPQILLPHVDFVARYAKPPFALAHIRVEDGKCTMRAMGPAVWVETSVDVFDAEDGETLVNAAMLSSVLKTLVDNQDITVSVKKRITIAQGHQRRRTLQIASPDDFPSVPACGDNVVQLPIDFISSLDLVKFAVTTDANRPTLTGICLDGRGVIAAADGVRAAVWTVPELAGTAGAILPISDVLQRAMSLADYKDETFTLTLGGSWVQTTFGHVEVRMATIAGSYPDVVGIVSEPDKDAAMKVVVNRKDLRNIVGAARIYTNSQMTKLHFECTDGVISFSVESPDGTMKDEITCEGQGSWVVDLSPVLLDDALAACPDDKLEMYVWAPHKPILLVAAEGKWNMMQVPLMTTEDVDKYRQERADAGDNGDSW